MFDPPGSVALYFQPIVSLDARRIIGFTAHSLRPGDEVLRAACRIARRWEDGIVLGVELSPARWHDPATGLRVLSALGESGLAPARLELEIGESVLSGGGRTMMRVVEELRQAGVMVALTGCGAHTESTVPSFSFDTLKLCPSVVARLGHPDCDHVTDTLVTLAADHGLVVSAAGITREAQLTILTGKNCATGQGPLFGKPVSASGVAELLRYPGIAEAVA